MDTSYRIIHNSIAMDYVTNIIVIILMYGEIQEYFLFALCTLFHIKFHHHRVVAKNATARSFSSLDLPSLLVKRMYLMSD